MGQYVFNQSWEQRAPEDRLGRTRVVRYDRVQMLEAAFDVEYIPPPGCSDWATDADMVRCSNHRMRALRAFVESDGTVTPDMMGINDSVDAGRPPENASATSDWRWEQAQQGYGDPAEPWSRTWQQMESDDTTRDPGLWQEEDRDWEEAPSYPGEYWREQHTPGPKADSGSNWQEEPEPYSYSPEDWTRQRDWRQEQNRQTQTDQYPDEDWPARQEWRQDAAPDQMRQWSDDWRPQEYAPESGGWLWGQEGSRELSTPAPEGYE